MRKQHKLKLYFHFLFAIILIAKICVANEDFTPTISKVGGGVIIKKGVEATFTVSPADADSYIWTFPSGVANDETIAYTHDIAEKKTLTCNVTKDGVTKPATKDFYWYDIIIIRDIDDDITDDTTEVWVGEKISLTAIIIS